MNAQRWPKRIKDAGSFLVKKISFDRMFLCIQCVRDWRERGLGREGLSSTEILAQLDKEYPLNKHGS